jgi:hypothetical protein
VDVCYQTIPKAEELFAQARERMTKIEADLLGAEARLMSHAEVERFVNDEGRELLRELLQAHFKLRGMAEPTGPVVGADGVERTHRRADETRPLATVLGPVAVVRTGYSARHATSLMPVDAGLNLPAELYSLEVRRRMALLASRVSFDAAVGEMSAHTGAPVPKRQAEELVGRAATDFEAFYAADERAMPPESTSELLILSFDGKGVVVRKDDLRPATRKAASQGQHKLDTRLAKGEKPHRKRMATVAAVYTVAPYVRSAADVIASLRHLQPVDRPARPRPEFKRVWASLEREMDEVIDDAFAEAVRRDPQGKKRLVVLVDGDPKQIRRIRGAARRWKREITLVLDFIHVLERLWKAAYCLHTEGTTEAEAWVLERLERVLEGASSLVAAGMRRSATRRGLASADRKPIDACANYLLKYRGMLRYDAALRDGLPIATGIIEGACRHLICDRMDLTGARWSLVGAEAVLRLRAILSSGDFDAYWAFHERQEYLRTHAARYADGAPPPVELPSRRRHLHVVRSAS